MRMLQQGCDDHEALLVEGNLSAEATVWTHAWVTRKACAGSDSRTPRTFTPHPCSLSGRHVCRVPTQHGTAHGAREG